MHNKDNAEKSIQEFTQSVKDFNIEFSGLGYSIFRAYGGKIGEIVDGNYRVFTLDMWFIFNRYDRLVSIESVGQTIVSFLMHEPPKWCYESNAIFENIVKSMSTLKEDVIWFTERTKDAEEERIKREKEVLDQFKKRWGLLD